MQRSVLRPIVSPFPQEMDEDKDHEPHARNAQCQEYEDCHFIPLAVSRYTSISWKTADSLFALRK